MNGTWAAHTRTSIGSEYGGPAAGLTSAGCPGAIGRSR